MWDIRVLKIVILYSSILFLIFGFSGISFNESFAQEQEFDENISVTLDSDISTVSEPEQETEPTGATGPQSLPEPQPEPEQETQPEPEPQPEPEQETQPEPEPQPEPEQETQPELEPQPEPEQETEPEPEPESIIEYNGLSVNVDKTDQPYEYGDYVTITGSGATKSSKITIEIIPPDGSEPLELSFFSTSSGDFSTLFLVSDGALHGTYTILASDSTESGTTTFSVHTESESNTVIQSSSDSDSKDIENYEEDDDDWDYTPTNPLTGLTCNGKTATIEGSILTGQKNQGNKRK